MQVFKLVAFCGFLLLRCLFVSKTNKILSNKNKYAHGGKSSGGGSTNFRTKSFLNETAQVVPYFVIYCFFINNFFFLRGSFVIPLSSSPPTPLCMNQKPLGLWFSTFFMLRHLRRILATHKCVATPALRTTALGVNKHSLTHLNIALEPRKQPFLLFDLFRFIIAEIYCNVP